MEYTQSPDHATHGGTGNRQHTDTAPIPTAVTANDMNMVIWSLMEVVKLAGMSGVPFNPNDPASYQRLLSALRAQFLGNRFGWNADQGGDDRLNFAEGAATAIKGYGSIPISFLNQVDALLAYLVDDGRLVLGADGVNEADAARVGQVLRNAMDVWITDKDGNARLRFEAIAGALGTTYYQGHGTSLAHEFRNGAAAALMRLYTNGNMTLPGLSIGANDSTDAVPTTAWAQTMVGNRLNSRPAHTYAQNDWFWVDKPNGYMAITGQVISTTDGTQTVSFVTPFPTECLHVLTTRLDLGGGTRYPMNPSGWNRFGFNIDRVDDIDSDLTALHFIAFGS